ncbi:MAG TPA: phosphate acyltransferase PlsX [Longimicrobiales bacterium]|nr:phosphate acyltransferase PlsX [Longimicrobiales bacterium]
MRIALDAMGTDHAPATEVAGALQALKELEADIEIVLVGDQAAIEAELALHEGVPTSRLHIFHAPDRIRPSDPPAAAVRKKPDSSIVRGLRLHKEGGADAFISAGSTGAVMASSLFILRPLPGVDRPTIATIFPTSGAPCLVVDAGANVDCKPWQLVEFAHLASVYAKDVLEISRPRIGLLNIGEEPEKGNEVAVSTYDLLSRDARLHFVGNVEGRDIVKGVCDVLVTDGFTGNVLLKFYESVAQFIAGLLKQEVVATGSDLDLDRVFRVLDYSEYGGVPLLGVNGVAIICHGGSPPKAIRNAVRVAAQAVRSNMVADMAQELAQIHTQGSSS